MVTRYVGAGRFVKSESGSKFDTRVDPETGLSEIPEGYRWNINALSVYDSVNVILEREETSKFLWWSWTSWHRVDEEFTLSPGIVHVRSAARKVVTRVIERDRMQKMQGTYPPHRLGA